MSRIAERSFLKAQESELLQMMRDCSSDDWFRRDTLQARLEAIQEKLEALPTETDRPRPAEFEMLFDGDPVEPTEGIQAEFVPEAIEKFVYLVYARLEQFRKKAARAIQAQFNPRPLMIVGTAGGSFGFQFREASSTIEEKRILGSSFTEEAVKDAVALINDFNRLDDDQFNQKKSEIDRRSIQALAGFFQHIVNNHATLKFRSDMIDSNFDKVAVIHIADRAKYVEKQTYTIDIPGMLYGLMPFSRRFEFQPQVGRWFDGRLADTFDSASVPRELPSKCVGVFFQAKDVHAGKGAKPRWRYELLALKPWEGD